MGFFSNLNMVQESDREQAAVFQAEMPEPKNQPVQAVPSTDTADGMTAAPPSAEASKPAEKEKTQPEQAEEEKRKAHEEAEAKRKEKERLEWEKAIAMDNDTLIATSVKRLGDATERLTRRNMKLCVTEYVQTLCYEDMAFARLVMHPRKSMINCFHFINRKAREYLGKEMKDNDEKPMAGGYSGDVPDDKKKKDKKFVPRPYRGISSTPKKKAEKKKPQSVKKEKPKEPEQLSMDNQITLDSFLQPEKMAG